MPTRTTFGTRQAFGRSRAQPTVAPSKPARQTAPVIAPAPAEQIDAIWPFLTIGLCILLFAVFVLQIRTRVDPLPYAQMSLRDCVALGGVGRYLVFHEREWWRIFTAPFLHGSAAHLFGNMVALLFAGLGLERVVGRAWLAALFVLGALGGSFGSLFYGDVGVSVGASGAIVCLVTALFALSYHYKAGKMANWMRTRGILGVVSAFLPSAAHGPVQIDYGAHLGGFATGIVLSFMLLIFWPDEEAQTPPLRALVAVIAGLGVAITLYAGLLVDRNFDTYAARSALLIPSAEEQSDPEGLAKQSVDLVARYPHDPLARLLRGTDLFNHRDFSDAEDEARAGLAEHEILATQYAPVMVPRLALLLAAALWGEGRKDEAKQIAAPLCVSAPTDEYLAKGREIFRQAGICG